MAKQVFQIQIALKYIEPKIWRRLLVESNTLLSDLHDIIQRAMGWHNSHLHVFTINKIKYAAPEFELMNAADYSDVEMKTVFHKVRSKIHYEYDFGDCWGHEIILEKIIDDHDEASPVPICLKGEGACPPEDCGGPSGYMDLLEIIKDPEYEDYETMIEWVGEDYDPAYFDIDSANKRLMSKKKLFFI